MKTAHTPFSDIASEPQVAHQKDPSRKEHELTVRERRLKNPKVSDLQGKVFIHLIPFLWYSVGILCEPTPIIQENLGSGAKN